MSCNFFSLGTPLAKKLIFYGGKIFKLKVVEMNNKKLLNDGVMNFFFKKEECRSLSNFWGSVGVIKDEDERREYSEYATLLELGKDETILPFVNHPLNIGHGEMKLLEKGIEYILTNNIISKYVFKITPRYKLTDRFNLDNYKTDKYCFQTSFDVAIKEIVYITKLYSIPFNKLNNYKIILEKGQNILSKDCHMVEKLYIDVINPEQVHLMKTLGVEGNMSYNKEYFNI